MHVVFEMEGEMRQPVEIDNKRVFLGISFCSVHHFGRSSPHMFIFSLLLCPIRSYRV